MSTMWTPAPQRNVLRQQEYRRWMMTTETRETGAEAGADAAAS